MDLEKGVEVNWIQISSENIMEFVVTKARYHPLYGLYITDQVGTEYSAETKLAFVQMGILTLIPVNENIQARYKMRIPENAEDGRAEMILNATDCPVALELAERVSAGGIPPTKDWIDLPIPTLEELHSRWAWREFKASSGLEKID